MILGVAVSFDLRHNSLSDRLFRWLFSLSHCQAADFSLFYFSHFSFSYPFSGHQKKKKTMRTGRFFPTFPFHPISCDGRAANVLLVLSLLCKIGKAGMIVKGR